MGRSMTSAGRETLYQGRGVRLRSRRPLGSPELVVIGEMKQSFTLELVLQAVDRTSVCDEVWLAVRASKRGRGRENDSRVKKLCRFLGFGLLTINAEGRVTWLWSQRYGSRGATLNGVRASSRSIVAARGIPSWAVRLGRLR